MGNFIKTQSSFAHGAIAPEFYAHDDLNGVSELQNMDILPGGGFTRRCGLVHVADLNWDARLIPFSVSDDENYIIALGDGHLKLMRPDGTNVIDLWSPWNADAIPRVQYAQRFGTMIFVHPDYKPQILHRSGNVFALHIFDFERNDADLSVNMPFVRFDDSSDITITVSAHAAGNNYATLTTSSNFWTPNNINTRIDMLGKQWVITGYTDARIVTAYVNGGYTMPTSPVSDWRESAFSDRRGWPCSITFHQDRLVYGGSRDYPSGVWMSQVGRHSNFNVGTGLDDQAIFITLLSNNRQQICTVVSSDNLQILTTGGEWAISSKPLTPSSVDIKQHTSVGSIASRYLAPQRVEGATTFVSGNGRDIRELSLDDFGENYNANDLCAYAKHLMRSPIDIAYNDNMHQMFVVMENGNMAVLNQNAALGISAWGTYCTSGAFRSVAVLGGNTYVLVRRGDGFSLERFSRDALSDVGNAFSCVAAGIPLRASGHNADKLRIRKVTTRITDTKTLFINNYRAQLPNSIYAPGAPGFTGDVSVNLLGTSRNFTDAPWHIFSNESLPLTVLSVTVYGFYTV